MIATARTAPTAMQHSLLDRRVSARGLVATLFLLTGAQHMLLWRFLGLGNIAALATGAALLVALVILLTRRQMWLGLADPSMRTCMLAFGFALLLYLLGGEGRLFYANTDWQVRGAVLRDLTVYPWPFAYAGEAGDKMLRAPLGMYLIPAIAGKLMGLRAAEFAMLAQNSAMLAMILALGAQLYDKGRDRMIALTVVTLFSGMDVLGTWLNGYRLDQHLEHWMYGAQYSAHVTQAFWVPQHAMAGWTGALFYLLWRAGKAPRVALLAWMPLAGLLSPLALIGLLPFAAHAGLDGLLTRKLAWRDILLPTGALLLSAAALVYLVSGSETVGSAKADVAFVPWCLFILIEVAPLLLALRLAGKAQRFGPICAAIVIAVLLLAPFGKIGTTVDFMMRATIPALAILSVIIADIIIARSPDSSGRLARRIAIVALLIGAVTPLTEIIRAFRFPVSPNLACSYMGVVPGGAPTYIARVQAMPHWLVSSQRNAVKPHDPAICWDGPWPSGEKLGLFETLPKEAPGVFVPDKNTH